MKYRQLTKEQFEELNHEFALFLASQSIDIKEWNTIKKEKPKVAEEELNIFSDMVWEDVLTKTEYLDHYSKTIINLFKCNELTIERIVIKVNWDINFFEERGMKWLLKNPFHNDVELFKGTKKYDKDRNVELFQLIENGSIITNGELFEQFKNVIS